MRSPCYVLVGMRVQGDTMPRPIAVGGLTTIPPVNPDNAVFTEVVNLETDGGGGAVAGEQ